MAKKVDDELADPYERVIKDMIPPCILYKAEEEADWTNLTFQNGWDLIQIPGLALSVPTYESSIDLSGYANQSLTFFPQSGFIQKQPAYRLNSLVGDGRLYATTIISTVPLDLVLLGEMILNGSGPGLTYVNDPTRTSNDFIDWSQVLWCQTEYAFANNTLSDTGFMQVMESGQIGSLSATAADKLYVYAIVMGAAQSATSLAIPAMRLGLIGQMAKEPTLEYMMRLANSYQLANQV